MQIFSFTKVVTQNVQFLSDSRVGDSVAEHGDAVDEEDMELTKSPSD